jgi:hypothetical protein
MRIYERFNIHKARKKTRLDAFEIRQGEFFKTPRTFSKSS